MTLYIGVDIHARQQTVSYLDTEDGSIEHQELDHERDDVRAFYSQFQGEVIVGIEACGYTNWFEEMVEETCYMTETQRSALAAERQLHRAASCR